MSQPVTSPINNIIEIFFITLIIFALPNLILGVFLSDIVDDQNTFYQSCVIPYRLKADKLEILLITSIRKRKWILPKGFVEFNLSAFESAKKEAFEEAGVLGSNETTELGEIKVNKNERTIIIKIYSMEVTDELDSYPEMNLRKRKWLSVSEAIDRLEQPQIKNYIHKLDKLVRHS